MFRPVAHGDGSAFLVLRFEEPNGIEQGCAPFVAARALALGAVIGNAHHFSIH